MNSKIDDIVLKRRFSGRRVEGTKDVRGSFSNQWLGESVQQHEGVPGLAMVIR